jgi:transcriptional regulator with XRE-family HTH domain
MLNGKELGLRIAALRQQLGENMTSFARLTGVSRSRLYTIEAGEGNTPTVRTLDRVAEALVMTLDELVKNQASTRSRQEPAMGPMSPSLSRFLREWELEHEVKMPKDVVRSLVGLQFRKKRPRTVEDWRVIYAVVDRLLRD